MPKATDPREKLIESIRSVHQRNTPLRLIHEHITHAGTAAAIRAIEDDDLIAKIKLSDARRILSVLDQYYWTAITGQEMREDTIKLCRQEQYHLPELNDSIYRAHKWWGLGDPLAIQDIQEHLAGQAARAFARNLPKSCQPQVTAALGVDPYDHFSDAFDDIDWIVHLLIIRPGFRLANDHYDIPSAVNNETQIKALYTRIQQYLDLLHELYRSIFSLKPIKETLTTSKSPDREMQRHDNMLLRSSFPMIAGNAWKKRHRRQIRKICLPETQTIAGTIIDAAEEFIDDNIERTDQARVH